MFSGIKNKEELARTTQRETAVDILSSGLSAIDTKKAVHSNISANEEKLSIDDHSVSLEGVSRIHIIGFGKAACEAAKALEEKLGNNIESGVAIDNKKKACRIIDTYTGDHPKPADANVEASQEIVALADSVKEDDLVLVAVSGGGSSLLCWPPKECQQSQILYDEFLESGGTISELNTVRKHLSKLKGGGLAKRLYPAQVIGLIFSDVPGGDLSDVASGPTFRDHSTIADAKEILDQYGITHDFDFYPSPEDKQYFENVTNLSLVTNQLALQAMLQTAEANGLSADILSSQLYGTPKSIIRKFRREAAPGQVLLGGGEVSLEVPKNTAGKGGRNQQLALSALRHIDQNELFIAAASDGRDNTEAAGAIVDHLTKQAARDKGLQIRRFLEAYNSFRFFAEVDDLIYTGPTGANVADLMIYINYE
jgi:glycerate-2-kinase